MPPLWLIWGLCWEACLFLGERVVEGVLVVDVLRNVALVAYKVYTVGGPLGTGRLGSP